MTEMENKAEIAGTLARLLSRPESELLAALDSGAVAETLAPYLDKSERGRQLFGAGHTIEGLSSLYEKTMGYTAEKRLHPVESLFKAWCSNAMEEEQREELRGLLMGDPAVHMLTLYSGCGIDIPEEYHSRPDHLVLQLEFLSLLYENSTDGIVLGFITDHLDWMPELRARCGQLEVPDFYIGAVEAIDSFLNSEIERIRCLQEVRA